MNEDAEELQATRSHFDELCRKLNMDEAAGNEAWNSYERISKNYTLEGNALHWLACALYVSCRQMVPTVSNRTVEGNYVSLAKILHGSELSLIEFFNKMKKWEDMANLSQEFRERTKKLERNFTVSAVIFKKYIPIFKSIFREPHEEPQRQQRSRKQRRQPCTVSEVFNFCWLLFIHAKGNFPRISDDLVNSYHLLLCALDLVYGNALLCPGRKELLNPSFTGLPDDFSSKDYRAPPESPCIISQLCMLHDGLVLDAKGIKEHFWKPFIRKLFEKKILKGKEETLTGFLDPGNFGDSLKAITRAYEEYVLSMGSLDERIFLGEDASDGIGTPSRCVHPAASVDHRAHTQQQSDKAFPISAPLTSHRYSKESSIFIIPGSMATQSISRLHSMLIGLKSSPSEKLDKMLKSCSRDPSQVICNRLKEMCDIFCQSYTVTAEESPDIAIKFFCLAEILYYKILEGVLVQEKRRLGDIDLSGILEQDVFHRSLMACCLEIILFSYKPPGDFPWIIEIFDLPAYHFYKVIEVLIRTEDGLFREVVKHLDRLEEQVLESMAWKQESPLWEYIRGAKNKVPTCEEVMTPDQFEYPEGRGFQNSPLTSNRVNEIRTEAGRLVSSSPATLHDRYSSPAAGSARRRLFVDGDSNTESSSTIRVSQSPIVNTVPMQNVTADAMAITPVPGQTVVTMATATVTANNGQTVTIPVQGIANENGGITFIPVQVSVTGTPQSVTSPMQPLSAQSLAGPGLQVGGGIALQSPGQTQKKHLHHSPAGTRPRKTGSMSLFFRKVYRLVSMRLRDLCSKLDIPDELRRKVWTCFEHSLVQHPELMVDRHLDQLLMCAIYVMSKVTKEDKSFQNIMKCYRMQPQACSSVYRSVLLRGRRRRNSGSSDCSLHQNSPGDTSRDRTSRDSSPVVMRSSSTLPIPQPNSAPPTPTRLTGANSDMEEEERGDLIQFYNSVYVKQIRDFALRYVPGVPGTAGVDPPSLSPYPLVKTGSPRRVLLSQQHSIYISPHKNGGSFSPREKIFYYFSNSPSKRLREINNMIKTGETPTKKRSISLEDGSESPAKRICQENQNALFRRLQDVANDRSLH
ncbi:RBL2 protein, partial [Polypterus senegalus]|nr:retinoblastoma-like protein 2 [Polypterus senegalus]MBN3294718.1 RBL2 protein [Polypterus senegalus]